VPSRPLVGAKSLCRFEQLEHDPDNNWRRFYQDICSHWQLSFFINTNFRLLSAELAVLTIDE
jgi:hypothetical protein